MGTNRIFIGNLDFSVTAEEVAALLSNYGAVVSVSMNRKKGFGFVEMEQAESAARAVQQLDGKLHKGRALRVSFEMKARRARTASAKRYKEKGDAFARQKAARYQPEQQSLEEKPLYPRRSAGAGERPVYRRTPMPDAGFTSRGGMRAADARPPRTCRRDTVAPGRPVKRPWSEEKPSYPRRSAGAGERTAYRRTPKPDAGFTPRGGMRAADARPPRTYQRDTGAPGRPVKRPWSEEKPLYPRPAERDGGRDGYARAPKKEWPSARPSRPAVKTGEPRGEHSQRKKTSGGKPHDFLKQRPAGGTHGKYSKPSRPGARRAAGTSAPSRHKVRGNSQDRGTPRKETEQ